MSSEPLIWLVEAQNRHLCEIVSQLRITNASLERIATLIGGHQPPPVGSLTATPAGENHGAGQMGDRIIYDVNLPSLATPSDVVTRELTIIIGEDKTIVTADRNDTVVAGLEAPQDAHVRLELVDIDDSGNRSEASVYEFDALDTFAPPKPGEFGIVIVGEDINPSPCPE